MSCEMTTQLTARELEQARTELQALISFSLKHLPDPSSSVAKEVHQAIAVVKRIIEEATADTNGSTQNFRNLRTEENAPIPVKSSDKIRAPPFLQPLISYGNNLVLPLSTPAEAIALFCHAIIIEFDGIICIAEKSGGGVPGFAAPLAPLQQDTLIPPGWNKKTEKIVFLYKHKAQPGKKISVEVVPTNDEFTTVKIGFKTTSKPLELVFSNTQYLNLAAIKICTSPEQLPELYIDTDSFANSLSSSIVQEFPFLQTEDKKNDCGMDIEGQHHMPIEVTRELPPSHLQRSHINRVPVHSINDRNISSVGSSDLHPPLPSLVPPLHPGLGPQGQLPSLYDEQRSSNQPVSNDGMLVGPDHAMFQGGFHGHRPLGGAPGFGANMPQPRFDPVVNPDIYTDPIVGGGVINNQGRGRGRGRGASRVPGEPNPDHLKPPDFGDII